MWLLSNLFKAQWVDIIRWENPSSQTLVWKFPQNLDQIENNSSLIVDPWLASIFIHNWKIEAIQQESWKWSLETDNIPFLSSLKNVMSGFETHDKAQVFFIKTNQVSNNKWGTPNPITYIDPVYDFPVELRAFWNFTFQVSDIEKFWVWYVANREEVSIDSVRMIIVDRLMWQIASIFGKKRITYNEIDAHTFDISKELMEATKDEFWKLWLELTDFRIEDINFTEKTEDFIAKITSKSADVQAINKTAGASQKAMENYSQIEKLNIAWKAAESGWAAWDMMWAGIWMAMWMNMGKQMSEGNTSEQTPPPEKQTVEQKLEKLKWLLEKELISKEDYDKKKSEILSEL